MKYQRVLILTFVLSFLLLYLFESFVGFRTDFYSQSKNDINIEASIVLEKDDSLNIKLEKFFYDENLETYQVFGQIEYNANLEKYAFINPNCIGLKLGTDESLQDNRAEVYNSSHYVIGRNLNYSKDSYEKWKRVYWMFKRPDLSVETFDSLISDKVVFYQTGTNSVPCSIFN